MKFLSPLRIAVQVGMAFGAFACAAADKVPADLIIHNANVITLDSRAPHATAVAVSKDRIIAIGHDAEMAALSGPHTRTIDAHGKTLLPGLYDNHVQSYDASVSELSGPSPGFTSLVQALDYIRHQAAAKPTNSWIILNRLYPTRLEEGRLPTLAELDNAAPRHPVYWDCGFIGLANTMALKISKITNSTPNPPGGEIVRDLRTLKATGLLRNAAGVLKIPPTRPPTAAQRRAALKNLYELYNEQGITSIGENRAQPEAIDLFREMSRDGDLSVRINCARMVSLGTTLEKSLANLDALTNLDQGKGTYGPTGAGDDWVRIGPLRVTVDGDVTTGTAYLRAPWGIGPTYQIKLPAYSGVRSIDPEILPDLFLEAANRGWQLSAHAAGDAALDSILNCYQYVQFQTNLTQRRSLITHADFQAAQNWEKFQKLAVGAEIQPISLYEDASSLVRTLGDNRMRWFLPLKTWLDKGLVVGAGSDHVSKLDSLDAANPWNPWLGMWVTLTRSMQSGAALHPEQCISREQAVRLYTFNNAWLNFEDKKKGSLEPGKLADLIMIDRDIMKCPVNDVRDTKVVLTMVGGRVVWEAGADNLQTKTPAAPPLQTRPAESPAPAVAVKKPDSPAVPNQVGQVPAKLEADSAPAPNKPAIPQPSIPVASVESQGAVPAANKPEGATAAAEKSNASAVKETSENPPVLENSEAAPVVEKTEIPTPETKPVTNAAAADWSRLSASSAH